MNKFYQITLTIILIIGGNNAIAQNNVGIGTTTPDPSAVLDIVSADKGMLVPRMTSAQRIAIVSPAIALLVFDTDVQCFYYYDNSSTWINLCNGNPGPQGPQGIQGIAGATGPQGPIGLTGANGAVGPAGIDGVDGATGPQGIQGIQGNAGPAGADGIDGATGPQGIQGIAGPVGPQGIQGNTGPAGANGIDGATGPQGIQGIAGPIGPQGIQGVAGPAGADGIDGATGPQGIQGIAGPIGPQGIQGVSGPAGADGIDGVDGAVGATGPQGIQGIAGPIGPQGIQGVTGPAGADGIDGVDGAVGATGPQGIQGIAGPIGPQGIQGVAGPAGADGIDGVDGAVGATGPQGIQGIAGPAGADGQGGVTSAGTGVTLTGTGTIADPYIINENDDDWKILGNAGTDPATNFIGTTDNQSLVIRTNNIERMRVLNTGNVGINTINPLDKLHITDATTPNAASVRISGLSSTSSLITNASDVMVMSDANGTLRRSNEAIKDAWYTTGNATTAVRSIGTTTNQAYQFIANNIARGRVNPVDGEFVWGGALASPYAGDALCAVANAATTFAVNGYSAQNGSGVWGEILSGTTNFSAVQGVYSGSGVGAGALGNYNGTNTSNTRAGVIGINGTIATGGTAVLGNNTAASGNQHMGVLGMYNGSAFGIGVYGIGFGGGIITGNNDIGVVGWRANNANYSGYFNGNHVIANGTKSASVPTSNGNQLLYCMESPEVWFEDFGTAKLVNGVAEVKLDEMYLETVLIDADHPMLVFVQVQGECNDVYVTPGTTSFTVKEKNNGTSNITFSYRLVAKRIQFPDHRFGNDPVWGEGDNRQYMEIAPKRPIEYQEVIKQDEEMKKNWKPSNHPNLDYLKPQNTELQKDTKTKQ